MSDNTLANPQSISSKKTIVALFVFVIIVGGLLVFGGVWHNEPESRWWIVLLLGIPCLLQFTGLCVLKNRTTYAFWWFNFWATLCCQVSYSLLWVMYSFASWKPSQWLSRIALGLTFLMLLFVTAMTFAIMGKREGNGSEEKELEAAKTDKAQPNISKSERDQSSRHWEKFCSWWDRFSRNLNVGVGDHPFWAIMFFMALFLGVSYLFGFALAFHDQFARKKDEHKPALHMVKLESIDDEMTATDKQKKQQGSANEDNAQTDQGTTSQSATNAASIDQEEEFCFYFDEVRANVNQSNGDCRYGNPKRMDSDKMKQPLFNSCSLNAIASTIQGAIKNDGRVKVTLLGHADNEPIKVANSTSISYLSNYELSEARAQNVEYEILQALRKGNARNLENIEWVIFPAAGEASPQVNRGAIRQENFNQEELRSMGITSTPDRKGFLTQIESRFTTEAIDHKLPPQEKRVVIATIEKLSESPIVLKSDQFSYLKAGQQETLAKLAALNDTEDKQATKSLSGEMKLMDYMYFSIYTITTTGYGDIIPTTAYAKFVTSVANIFEVIFLVVFFNALLSLKKSSNDPKDPQAASENLNKDTEDLNTSGQRNLTTFPSKTMAKGRLRH